MKRWIWFVLAIVVLCPLTVACTAEETEAEFSPELEAAVRTAIGNGTPYDGALTEALLDGIVMLDIALTPQSADGSFRVHTPEDLRGLAHLKNLRALRLSFYNGVSLSFLAEVPGLRLLELTWSGGKMLGPELDLTALKALSGIAYLEISGYRVTDLREIGQLVSLEHLALTGNGCSFVDLTPLQTLSNLRGLTLTRWSEGAEIRPITDLTPLKALAMLEYLKLDSFVGDLTPLKNLSIRQLALAHSEIADYAALPRSVRALMIGAIKDPNDQIHTLLEPDDINFTSEDIQHLQNLPNLRYLQIYQRLETSVALAGLTSVHRYSYAYEPGGAATLTDAESKLLRNGKSWNDEVYTDIYRNYLTETAW